MFNYMCIYTSLHQEHVCQLSFLYLEQQITDTTKDVGAQKQRLDLLISTHHSLP